MMPFVGGLENLANGALVFSVLAALLYLFAVEQRQSWRRTAIKTLSVALLAVVAAHQNAPLLLIIGLALSAAGDFFLSRDGDRNFLAGLGSFLAAHIVYVVLFYGAGVGAIAALTPGRTVLALGTLLLSLGMLQVLLRRVEPAMRLPIVAYVVAIQLMGVAALTTGSPLVVVGALLFMASDTILAWEKFVETGPSSRRSPMRIAVWLLYYAAQLSITLGFVLPQG